MVNRRLAVRLVRASVLAAALGFALWVGPGGAAHALRSSSDPADGATLANPPSQVVITFTEQPDAKRSTIEVLDTSGKRAAGPTPQLVAGQPATVLRIPVTTTLPKGVYTVNWKTISAVDGHLATGSFSFGVGQTPPAGGVTSTVRQPGASEVASVSRWLCLAGLIGLLGLTFTQLVVIQGTDAPRRLAPALRLSWVMAAGGIAGTTLAQASGAQLGLGDLLSSSIGHALILRTVPVLAAGLALLFLKPARRGPAVGLLLATLVAMLADVLKSHAAASASWVWFRVATQWIHFAAAGIWVGGLTGLLLCLVPLGPGNRGPAARRFSFFAGIAIVLVGMTGTLRALDEVGSWHGLFHTGFGQLIVLKILLFGALAVLGAVNRFRNVPAVERKARGLRRTGGMELVAMILVLGATSVLQNLAPTRSAAAATSTTLRPVAVDGQDFAANYRLHLTVTPGTAGFNQFALSVSDYVTHKDVTADAVSVSFHYVDRPAVGDSTLALARQANGTYAARGANMSLTGHWTLTVVVQNGARSVDAPLDLVTQTQTPPPKVVPGPPVTTYTIALPGGRSVQIYTDPIAFNKAEFHATFADANGQEPTMATFAVMASRAPNGSATMLTTRQLSQGHFVADGPGQRGTYTFSLAGTTAGGDALGATISLPLS